MGSCRTYSHQICLISKWQTTRRLMCQSKYTKVL